MKPEPGFVGILSGRPGRWRPLLGAVAGAAVIAGILCLRPSAGPRASGPLSQEAYVWQRAWTEPVRLSIREQATRLDRLVVLKAEVAFHGSEPRVMRVAVDYATLRGLGRPIGLALRIGPYPGPFSREDAAGRLLSGLAAELVAEARTNGVPLAELQVDFDCAEQKLAGYQCWVEWLRAGVAPTPLVITVLPAWLGQPTFPSLVGAADGFVLQVHSLARPKSPGDAFRLCDPASARRAVERAAKLGRPFRVALPTYGYLAAFDRNGRFIGLSAEGPVPTWPAGVVLRDIHAEPEAMAELIRGWLAERPRELTGVAWYRFPVAGDQRNWRWATLAKVMAGESPRADVRAEARQAESSLVEVELFNRGTAEQKAPMCVTVSWPRGRLVASDGLLAYEAVGATADSIQFQRKAAGPALAPGERRTIGWLRFESETEVRVKSDAE